MKAPKVIAIITGSALALCLVGGLAFALEPIDPTTLPIPDKAQGTSIAKQVASIIVYEDHEEAVAMATEFDQIHEELAVDAIASRATIAKRHHAGTAAAPADAAKADAVPAANDADSADDI